MRGALERMGKMLVKIMSSKGTFGTAISKFSCIIFTIKAIIIFTFYFLTTFYKIMKIKSSNPTQV